jgi:biotin carboxylase
MKKKLAILGASYLQLPLIEKANSLGIETHVFAWKKENVAENISDFFYPISITEQDSILKKCGEIGIDGITSIASDLAVSTVNYIAHHLKLVGNPLKITKKCTNKFAMRLALERGGLSVPKYQLVRESSELLEYNWSFPVIVKPTDRSGSLGVTKVNNQSDLESAVTNAMQVSFVKEVIIEEFIEGREFSVEFFSLGGKHYPLVITDKVTTGPPHFVEIEHHQPAEVNERDEKAILEAVIQALEVLGIKIGASHTEIFLLSNSKVIIGEVGARMGGDLIGSTIVPLSTGFDQLSACIMVALGHKPEIKIAKKKNHTGIHYYTKSRPWVKRIIQEPRAYVVQSELFDKKNITTNSSKDRLGYFIYQSKTKIAYNIHE